MVSSYTSCPRSLRLTAFLFAVTLGAYLPLWLHRAIAQLRSVSAGATRLTPGLAAALAVVPFVNVAGLAYLAVDLPRGVRRAASRNAGPRQTEPEVLSILLLGAVIGGIALTVALDLPAAVAGYLAWPLELPAALAIQRHLNSMRDGGKPTAASRDRETLAALAVGVVVLAGAAIAVARSGDDEGTAPGAPALTRPAPTAAASDIAVSPRALWVSLLEDDKLERLDLRTLEPTGPLIPVGREPLDVAAADGVVWVANRTSSTVSRIDWRSGKPIGRPISTGRAPWGISIGLGGVWVSNQVERTVVKIDPRTGRLEGKPASVGIGPRGLAAGEGAVWVADFDGRTVSRVDPRTRGARQIALEGAPADVAAGEGAVWITQPREGLISVLDSDGRRAGAPIQVGGAPGSVEVGFGWVWVADTSTGAVVRIDPRTRRTAGRPVRIGGTLSDIAIGRGAVWALRADGKVRRLRPPPR